MFSELSQITDIVASSTSTSTSVSVASDAPVKMLVTLNKDGLIQVLDAELLDLIAGGGPPMDGGPLLNVLCLIIRFQSRRLHPASQHAVHIKVCTTAGRRALDYGL
jgi:hypothetical protein